MKKCIFLTGFALVLFAAVGSHASDYFTESFGSFDLDGISITFYPDTDPTNYYTAKAVPITELPTNPTGHVNLPFGDDNSTELSISTGGPVKLYGTSYSTYFLSSNGYITFNFADNSWDGSVSHHFNQPTISGLNNDLNRSAGGSVKGKDLLDRVVITYLNVPEFGETNSNTFQMEMFFDGRIRLSWLGIEATGFVVGLSNGGGVPSDFGSGSDLSSFVWDSDLDGLPDFWETLYFSGVTNGIPGNDVDGDGLTNLEEYIAETNPTNSSSVFRATQELLLDGSSCIVGWTAAEGRKYTVRTASSLLTDDFSTVLQSGLTYPVNAYTTTVSQAQQFFKVEVQLVE